MSAAALPRSTTVGPLRRGLLAVLALGLVTLLAAAAWSFAWPSHAGPREVVFGQLSEFPPGTVASFTVTPQGVNPLSTAGDYGPKPLDYPHEGRSGVHLVRLPDGQLRGFSGADEILGRTIVWYPLARDYWLGDDSSIPGRFAEPRRGTFWDLEGHRIFGPAPGGLIPLDIQVLADGTVRLDPALVYGDGVLTPRCSIDEPSRSSGDGTLLVTCDS